MTILEKFNPNAKIKHKEFVKLVTKLKPFSKMILDKKSESKENNEKNQVSKEMMDFGLELQGKILDLQQQIKDKLITTFYDISSDEFDNLEYEEYETAYNAIIEARPNLVRFFLLPQMEKETLTTQQENTSI